MKSDSLAARSRIAGASIALVTCAACSLLRPLDDYEGPPPVETPDLPGPEAGADAPATPDAKTDSPEPSPLLVKRPDQGRYLFVASGTQSLGNFDGSIGFPLQTAGPSFRATLTHDGASCWTIAMDNIVVNQRSDTFHYCLGTGGRLTLDRQTTTQTWNGAVNETTIVCDPAIDYVRPGFENKTPWTQSCSDGTNTQAPGSFTTSGSYVFRGFEDMPIQATTVRALRFHTVTTIAGSQSGDEEAEYWFRAEDGLPLRKTRKAKVTTPGLGIFSGNVWIYREDASWTLAEVTPAPLLDAGM